MLTTTMLRRLLILLIAVIIACPALAAKRRSVSGQFIAGERVLWVAAHPDDEIVAAPLLADLCIRQGARCSFLVATRGEGGDCLAPAGCPDLGAQRSGEMSRSAALFDAHLIQWSLPDVMNDVEKGWTAVAGDLVTNLADVIRTEAPDVILTFDPVHGTSCHPAHRLIGDLVLDAVDRLGGPAPSVFLLETATSFSAGQYRFANALPGQAWTFDATAWWPFLIDVAAIHESQFSPALLDALRSTPLDRRRLYVIPATSAEPGRYDVACP